MTALEQRLRSLEQRVDQLAAQTGGSEQLSPNYLSIDPRTGAVSASFSGSVNATELTLPSGPEGSLSAPNAVQWIRQADGALAAYTEGEGQTVGQPTIMSMGAQAPDTGGSAGVQAQGNQSNPDVTAFTFNPGQLATILDSLGQSSFVENSALASRKFQITGDYVGLTWPGGTQYSNSVPTLSIGYTSFVGILCQVTNPGTLVAPVIITAARGGNPDSFNVQGFNPGGAPGAGATCDVYYLLFSF